MSDHCRIVLLTLFFHEKTNTIRAVYSLFVVNDTRSLNFYKTESFQLCIGYAYRLRVQVHIYGTSLGGFLAQIFAQHRPRRVKSLVLSNTFLETHKFAAAMPWSPVYV